MSLRCWILTGFLFFPLTGLAAQHNEPSEKTESTESQAQGTPKESTTLSLLVPQFAILEIRRGLNLTPGMAEIRLAESLEIRVAPLVFWEEPEGGTTRVSRVGVELGFPYYFQPPGPNGITKGFYAGIVVVGERNLVERHNILFLGLEAGYRFGEQWFFIWGLARGVLNRRHDDSSLGTEVETVNWMTFHIGRRFG